MKTDQVVVSLVSLHKRLRAINAVYDGLEDKPEALTVAQAAFREMSVLHRLLPQNLKRKIWVVLSIEKGNPWGSAEVKIDCH